MGNTTKDPPLSYRPPHSALEIAACKFLFGLMLDPKRIQIDYGTAEEHVSSCTAEQFVVAAPPLWSAIKIIIAPNLWVGESFVAGAWYLKRGELTDFLHAITVESKPTFRAYYEWLSNLRAVRYYLGQFLLNRYYTRMVRKHYDVDPKIYEMILDSEMVYTCAFFRGNEDDLDEAQQNKLTAIVTRMNLPDSAQVLDIGCGWGAMERKIVRMHPTAQICGLSLSQTQIEWANRKDKESLSPAEISRIEYRVEDYVDHSRFNYYDAISVIGMVEHVGLSGYDNFFERIYRFLKPAGRGVIHTIVSPKASLPTNSWIDRHIFSGGYAPSVSELVKAIERHPFQISGMYVYPPSHYKRTIELWSSNLTANSSSMRSYLKSINYSDHETERVLRTWSFYLSGVRNMFLSETKSHQIIQIAIDKR